MRVLVIPEYFRKDQFIPQVLIELTAADSEELSIRKPWAITRLHVATFRHHTSVDFNWENDHDQIAEISKFLELCRRDATRRPVHGVCRR